MRYAKIRQLDISNGPGLRISLFTQGCDIRCQGCFNTIAWSFDGGKEWTSASKKMLLQLCDNQHIKGLSVLGGEPLATVNISALVDLFSSYKIHYPDKDIWLWTGHTLDYIKENWDLYKQLFSYIDVVVTEPFIMAKKDPRIAFRGSTNQKIYEVDALHQTFYDVSDKYDNVTC